MSLIDDIYVTLQQTESVPIATYNQLLDANESTMIAVRDKSRAASDQMNTAAKNAGQAIRYDHVHVVTLTTFVLCTKAKQFIILMTVLT